MAELRIWAADALGAACIFGLGYAGMLIAYGLGAW